MKKLFFTLLTLCLCGATYAQTTSFTEGGLTYNVLTDGLTVEVADNNTSASGAVEIPATVSDGTTSYTVVGIGQSAFAGSETSANTSITSVTIPYTVTYIGSAADNVYSGGAFHYCSNLASVTFDESTSASQLTTIGLNAFQGCSSLTSIDLPASVTTLGGNAFYGCSSLTEAKLPEGVTTIPGSCFRYCTNLQTVWMSGSAQIYSYAFADCQSLSAFVLEGSNPATTGGSEASGSNQFYDDAGDIITLYVPTGSAPAYLQTNWVTDMNNDEETLRWNFLTYTNGISENAGDGTGTYYATYYTDAVGEFGDDVTPCIVTGEEEGYVQYSSISGYIPANTGLLLTAESEEALTSDITTYYYHPYGVTEATADVTGNMLYGSLTGGTTNQPAESGYYYYKLSRNATGDANSVGFYWGAEYGAAFTNPAGKAYLALPISSVNSLSGISLKKGEEDTTGISSIESASEKAVSGIYTIQGVRVSNMNQPGLYIVDGKKVLVK